MVVQNQRSSFERGLPWLRIVQTIAALRQVSTENTEMPERQQIFERLSHQNTLYPVSLLASRVRYFYGITRPRLPGSVLSEQRNNLDLHADISR
jgi:hypothetical protein